MRGKSTFGRYSAFYEIASIGSGIENDLQEPMGQKVRWWTYNGDATEVDPVYSVGANVGTGRMWNVPFSMSVVQATIVQGPLFQNERGFYTMDNLTLVINATEMYGKLPDMAYAPDGHLKDRIEYRGHFFTPTMIYPKGHIQNHLLVVRVDALEVKNEELVNDSQFNHVANPVFTGMTEQFSEEFTHPIPANTEVDEDIYDPVTRVPPSNVGHDQNSWPQKPSNHG